MNLQEVCSACNVLLNSVAAIKVTLISVLIPLIPNDCEAKLQSLKSVKPVFLSHTWFFFFLL